MTPLGRCPAPRCGAARRARRCGRSAPARRGLSPRCARRRSRRSGAAPRACRSGRSRRCRASATSRRAPSALIMSGQAVMKSLTATIGPCSAGSRSSSVTRGERGCSIGMQSVPAIDLERLVAQQLVGERAPDLGRDSALGEQLLRAQRLLHDRATGQDRRAQRRAPFVANGWCGREAVEAADDVLVGHPLGPRRHGVVLVVERQVVEDVLRVGAVHALDAVADDDRGLVGERRVVHADRGDDARQHERVAVLVLQPLAVERRPAGRGARAGSRDRARRRTPRTRRRCAGSRTSNRRCRTGSSARRASRRTCPAAWNDADEPASVMPSSSTWPSFASR